MSVEMMKSKTRRREVVQARQIAMFFAKNMTKSSLATIGMNCGGKDHATVLHCIRTIATEIANYKDKKDKYQTMYNKLIFEYL
jgi:chromosomal replication initiator protein